MIPGGKAPVNKLFRALAQDEIKKLAKLQEWRAEPGQHC